MESTGNNWIKMQKIEEKKMFRFHSLFLPKLKLMFTHEMIMMTYGRDHNLNLSLV